MHIREWMVGPGESRPEGQWLGQLACCTLGSNLTTGHGGLNNSDTAAGTSAPVNVLS